jgi:hypothetical protein
MRVVLGDDVRRRCDADLIPTRVVLDDDLGIVPLTQPDAAGWVEYGPEPTPEVLPELTIARRVRRGYDEEGNPTFVWEHVLTGRAIVWTQSKEWDSASGLYTVTGTATVLYDGDLGLTASVSVSTDDGARWQVSEVDPGPDGLVLHMTRVAGDAIPEGS